MGNDYPSEPYATGIELILFLIITIISWIATISVLFPVFLVLYLSPYVRCKIYPYIYSYIVSDFIKRANEMREQLFRKISESLDQPGKICYLEIGFGNGLNLKYYSGNYSLTLLDINAAYLPILEKKIKKLGNVNVDRIIIADAANMTDIEDEQFDVVIATRFFATVNNPEVIMKEIKRVLKPGGKLGFKELIMYPKSHPAYWIQRVLIPLFIAYYNGHRYNEDLISKLDHHFSHISYEIMYPTYMPMVFRPHIIGIATK